VHLAKVKIKDMVCANYRSFIDTFDKSQLLLKRVDSVRHFYTTKWFKRIALWERY